MKTRWLALCTLSAIPLLLIVLALQAPSTQPQSAVQNGMTYSTWQSRAYTQPYADASLANLAATGADWIALTVIGYQDTIASTDIISTSADTATDAELIHVIRESHRLGLKVMLKPHVDVRSGEWRGLSCIEAPSVLEIDHNPLAVR